MHTTCVSAKNYTSRKSASADKYDWYEFCNGQIRYKLRRPSLQYIKQYNKKYGFEQYLQKLMEALPNTIHICISSIICEYLFTKNMKHALSHPKKNPYSICYAFGSDNKPFLTKTKRIEEGLHNYLYTALNGVKISNSVVHNLCRWCMVFSVRKDSNCMFDMEADLKANDDILFNNKSMEFSDIYHHGCRYFVDEDGCYFRTIGKIQYYDKNVEKTVSDKKNVTGYFFDPYVAYVDIQCKINTDGEIFDRKIVFRRQWLDLWNMIDIENDAKYDCYSFLMAENGFSDKQILPLEKVQKRETFVSDDGNGRKINVWEVLRKRGWRKNKRKMHKRGKKHKRRHWNKISDEKIRWS